MIVTSEALLEVIQSPIIGNSFAGSVPTGGGFAVAECCATN